MTEKDRCTPPKHLELAEVGVLDDASGEIFAEIDSIGHVEQMILDDEKLKIYENKSEKCIN